MNDELKIIAKCRICHISDDYIPISGKDVWSGKKEDFNYFECRNCGCVQLESYPENIADYYTGNYYSFNVLEKNSKFKEMAIRFRNKYAIYKAGFIGKYFFSKYPTNQFNILSDLRPSKKARILDIGCGDGNFLRSLHVLGFKNLLGIDPFLDKETVIDNNFSILRRDIYQLDGEFDLIVFKGTLEHQPAQLDLLLKASELLAKGGRCVIRIPVACSHAWEHYRTDWVQFDSPRHFYLHTEKSMKILTDASGFEIEKSFYDSDALQFIGSEQLSKGIALSDPNSYLVDKSMSVFSHSDIENMRKRVKKLDDERNGDVMVFCLSKD